MSHPVTTFRMKEKVGHVLEMIRTESFDGFPVVENSEEVSNVFVYPRKNDFSAVILSEERVLSPSTLLLALTCGAVFRKLLGRLEF